MRSHNTRVVQKEPEAYTMLLWRRHILLVVYGQKTTRKKDHPDKRPLALKFCSIYVEVVYNELQKKFAKSSSNISINTNRHVCC